MKYTNIDLYSGIARKADLHNPGFLALIKELETHQAEHLAGGWQRHWARRWELPFVFSSILALDYGAIKDKMILESGSGFTIFPLWLASYGAKLTLADFDKTLEKIWDDINSRISFANHPIVFNIADMQNLPYPDKNFDIVYSISAIEHTNDPIQSVSEMLRVTKSGGHIVFTMDLDIQNTDSVSRDKYHVIRSLLTLQTDPVWPENDLSKSEMLTFINRTLAPQSFFIISLKKILARLGLYEYKDQCIYVYSGRKK